MVRKISLKGMMGRLQSGMAEGGLHPETIAGLLSTPLARAAGGGKDGRDGRGSSGGRGKAEETVASSE